ncbi:MAG: type VI secretion protein ImpB, partial [Pseudomonadota bacterium]
EDIPGIGKRMEMRLWHCRIHTMEQLLKLSPKHMRKIWNNVTGERLWYALHGYDVQGETTQRGMFGHGRVLPPESRKLPEVYKIARLLLMKAARRLRREKFYCSGLWISLSVWKGSWGRKLSLPIVNDDQAILAGLRTLWQQVKDELSANITVYKVHVMLYDLSPAEYRQLDMLLNDDQERRKADILTKAIDKLNRKYSKTVISYGLWNPPKGGHVGGKISYTRIPRAEDFW